MSLLARRRPHRRKNPNEVVRNNDGSLPFGNKTVFTPEEEEGFVQFLKHMEKLRLPRNKKMFGFDIQFMVRYYGIENPFKDDIPGYYWMMRFLNDNKYKFLTDVEHKLISEKILKLSAFIQEAVVLIKETNNGMLLDSAKRLIILEMKMFVLDGGVKLAVIIYCDAAGKMFKPIVIHDKNLSPASVAMFQTGLVFRKTADGDLDKCSLDFVLDTIATSIEQTSIVKPVALLVGHEIAQHHTLVTWITTVSEGIMFIPMPACISDVCDSMDLGVISHLLPLMQRSMKMRFSQKGKTWTAAAFSQVLREYTRDLNAKSIVKNTMKRLELEDLLEIPKKKKTDESAVVQRLDIREIKRRRTKLECVLETEHMSIKIFK